MRSWEDLMNIINSYVSCFRTGVVPGGGKGGSHPYHFQKEGKREREVKKRKKIKKIGGKNSTCAAIFSSEQCSNPKDECIVMWQNKKNNSYMS